MEENIKLAGFRAELKHLLEKYNASMSILMGEGSDTHGIHGEGIGVQFFMSEKERWTKDYRLNQEGDWGLTAGDLE